MLYRFKSQAAADVLMLQPRAEEILAIIGKQPGEKGIVTVAQAPKAVAALRAEIERREALRKTDPAAYEQERAASKSKSDDEDDVTLRARATPFINLLEVSSAAGKDVVWGV